MRPFEDDNGPIVVRFTKESFDDDEPIILHLTGRFDSARALILDIGEQARTQDAEAQVEVPSALRGKLESIVQELGMKDVKIIDITDETK